MEEDVCRLCGTPDQDKRSDHLRHCSKIAQSKLDPSMFRPRYLSYEEMNALHRGWNPICSNRRKCLKRQKELKGRGIKLKS